MADAAARLCASANRLLSGEMGYNQGCGAGAGAGAGAAETVCSEPEPESEP